MTGVPGDARDLVDLPDLPEAVELLERALGHTRMALAAVRPHHLAAPTPCARWDLDDLLWHMDDALDAFTEAATGLVRLAPTSDLDAPLGVPVGVEARLGRLQTKACRLLGAWAAPPAEAVEVAGVLLEARMLVGTAALEITVHGWDVSRATGERRPVPEDLAARLLPVAAACVDPGERGRRFAGAVPVPRGAPPDLQLLAFLGRSWRAVDAA